MRNITFILTALLLVCALGIRCVTEENGANTPDADRGTDVTTMATPDGGIVKPADKGPVRSALGEPEIDLDTFHLDIAGPALLSKDRPYIPKGATGIGVRLIVELLENWTNRQQ